MRLIPRRKRTWLLVLLTVVILGAASIWLALFSRSEFEKQFDQIKVGMSVQEVLDETGGGLQASEIWLGPTRHIDFCSDEGDIMTLFFDEHHRFSAKRLTRVSSVDKLRRLWQRTFNAMPPF